jgi:CheY-like chemotaxis protein
MEQANEMLKRSQSAAQAANRAKTHFLTNMSHEIRTPLTSMIGFAELMLDDCVSKGFSERDATNLEAILRNGRHLLDIVNDILDLAKIEAGHLEVELISCSVSKVVAEALQSTRIQAEAKGLALHVEWATAVPESIRSDPTCLRRILINVMGNAVKFTSQGSVRLTIRLLDPNGPQPRLQFEIIDTGVGIPKEKQDSLFQPFVQADVSYRRRFGGTGLGLTISKQLLDKLGGTIGFESQPGLGTTFRIVIPTGPLKGAPIIENPSVQGGQDDGKGMKRILETNRLRCRILVAEDSADSQRLIAFILRKAGADVVVVGDGQTAVETALQSQAGPAPFDLVLMDMQMPVLDGYAATRRLRDAGFMRPIIALTAHTMSGEREKCLGAGCSDFCGKPIDRQRLLDVVGDHLSQRNRVRVAAGN